MFLIRALTVASVVEWAPRGIDRGQQRVERGAGLVVVDINRTSLRSSG
ncbi:hypothetical protein [Micromonospora carbonacea]|uniref:Uncharacterized protein n=1 Tax=Micromonospora carbonacea TaxID=47853 RepID=A0A7H8XHB8_9ACTN|nr:hypothetical protein [Micromonospora carbonacea]MBB5827920.1 hypothetical protein [Micromonospora carbonacea]QLD24387.1 hypothetical protein HXZ27_09355 [Micromonospora carbonacea]